MQPHLIGQTTTKLYLKRHMNHIDNRLLDPTDKQAVLGTVSLVLLIKNFGATRIAIYGLVLHVPCSVQCTHCATCLVQSVSSLVHNSVVVCVDYLLWQVWVSICLKQFFNNVLMFLVY